MACILDLILVSIPSSLIKAGGGAGMKGFSINGEICKA